MSLTSGTRLGPYEILSALGVGGMGEVYKARDTRLDRTVAIKVLPAQLAADPQFRERFEREARAVAALNHPHICTLHDIGTQDNVQFLVMEYLDGETLADRLKKGPLPLDQALQYSIQIASALDAAHRVGITHRDLKPGNVMVTKSGTKLLDFGLAKASGPTVAGASLSMLPTTPPSLTAQGTILGTFQYMAPEQLEGHKVDARADIFAFGAVFYEMLTGKKAFEGKSPASLIAAIIHIDPPAISHAQPLTPPALDHIVRRCLAKDPDERWQSAGDLMGELKWIADGGLQAGLPAPVPSRRKLRESLAWGAAAIAIVIAALLATVLSFRRAPAEAPSARFTVGPPENSTFYSQPGLLSVSPDGTRLAFLAQDASGKRLLWVRDLDALTARPVLGTDDALQPFWSPDSRFLAFSAQNKLKRIAVSGGPPQTVATVEGLPGTSAMGTWNRQGDILFALGNASLSPTIQRVSATGGTPVPVTTLDASRQEISHTWPCFLPDGKHFLYFANSRKREDEAIYVGALDSKDRKLVLNVSSFILYSPPGYLLFVRDSALMAQPFDADRLALTGEALPLAETVHSVRSGRAAFGISENGVLAYRTEEGDSRQLVWFDRAGTQVGILGDAAAYVNLELSRDGKQAAVTLPSQSRDGWDTWLYDVTRGLRTRLTFGPATARESDPIWSPDGSRIVFTSNVKGHFNLYQKAANGSGAEEVLLEDNVNKFPGSWSPDGRSLLYFGNGGGPTGFDLFVLPLFGDRKPFPFLQTQFGEAFCQFSPDGRWVAFTSNESGKDEVYVAPFAGAGGKRQISTRGGIYPRWSRDRKEIFYLAPDNTLMAAPVSGKDATFEVGAVKPLFQTRIRATAQGRGQYYSYDVSADGQRFLIITASEQEGAAPITVVTNWRAMLKK